ncbi:endothelin-converting enzyme 1-like isoform X2 [Ptychodera flava]|uniref:endothelin-converting enzyme 1-like isoform X2 n=1 Tax=Ptychodera flava TaxID=63121 RepID=UPI00396A93BD
MMMAEKQGLLESGTKGAVTNPPKRRLTLLEKFLIAVVLILLIIILTLASAGTFGYYYAVNSQVCLEPKCVEVSAMVLTDMNQSVDPCQDFYQYSCGGFLRDVVPPAGRSKWSSFSIVYEKNQAILKKLLEQVGYSYKGKYNTAIAKAKQYYNSCMNMTAINSLGATPMLELIGNLGSWTLTNDSLSGHWHKDKFSLEDRLVKAHKLGSAALFSVGVGADEKNSDRNVLEISQSGLGLASQKYYFKNDTATQREAYKVFLANLAVLLGADSATIKDKVEGIFNFETQLATIYTPSEELQEPEKTYHKMTVQEFSQSIPSIDFTLYLEKLFGKGKVKSHDDIIVYTPKYLTNMSQLIANTNKSILADYIMYQSISGFAGLLSDPFIDIVMQYVAATQGITDVPPRWKTCVSGTDSTLGFATGALFVQEEFTAESKTAVESMVTALKASFRKNLPTVQWMDEITRQKALVKLNAITDKIGYPKWLEQPEKLEEHYEKLEMSSTLLFKNALDASYFYSQKNLDKLGKPVDRSEWEMTPAQVNAYYSASVNVIAFPAGILQNPFYDPSFPMSINFGRVGMIIGHELTHGFDSNGRHYDEHGNMVNWWQPLSEVQFEEHAKCMVDQYNHYPVGSIHLDGQATINENIADNGGMKIAHIAYRDWVKSNSEEKSLPGLDMTQEQLFFLGHAQIWCTYYTDEAAVQAVYTDEHSIAKYRVIGVDSNFPAFSAAYKCPSGSPMNPQKKCTVW